MEFLTLRWTPFCLSVGECGAVFYFFGAWAAAAGPRVIVPVMGLPDFRIGSVISRGGRFSRDFHVVRGRPARKRLRRAAGCRFRAADPNGACRGPGPSHSRSLGPGRRTARAVGLWENLARNLESLRLRRHAISAAIHIRVISAVRPSCHACRQRSTWPSPHGESGTGTKPCFA